MNKKPIVVTTKHRGVFFGYVEDDSKSPSEIILAQVRMCVYWSSDIKGVLGLAVSGPSATCRITHAVSKVTLYDITGILDCSPDATEKWEQSLWK